MPICINQPISHGGNRLHMAPLPPQQRIPHHRGLSVGTINSRNGQRFGLSQDIRGVHIGGFYLMILEYTKITNLDCCRNMLGYNIV